MAKAEPRDKSAPTLGGSAAHDGVLHMIVDGLVARVEASPLMRRPAAQCSPDEQERLIAMLSALGGLRASQASLASLADVDSRLVEEVWPELAALLGLTEARESRRATPGSGASRPGSARSRAGAEAAARRVASALVEEVGPSAGGGDVEPATSEPGSETETAAEAQTERASTRAPVTAVPDLRDAVRAVLRTDNKPWSGARIASRVQEANPLATREQVYDTLYRHADLFRKTSRGWELVTHG